MRRRGIGTALVLILALCLAGCSSAPARLEFGIADDSAQARAMWPPAPDIPRYQFAGQLIGENNFVRDADADGALVRLFRWIAGLASSNPVTLQRPQGIAVDAAGRVFVSDVSRAAVFVFDPVAGELRLLEYANGLQRFINPVGVVTDPDGSLWVADAELAIPPEDGIELTLEATWAGDVQQAAATVELEPEGLDAKSRTAWSDGAEMVEYLDFTWR